ncbi:MAG: hypothetical protein PHP98_07370 [Kiritimatiellae bacterium]|nr:hypothetical protein [Kiritimatiellia bacterium]
MQIIIAGEDCTGELGAKIRQSAARLKKLTGRSAPPEISAAIGALTLRKASSDAEYLRHFLRLLRYRDAFDTYDFDIPRRPAPLGAVLAGLKKFLWKLLRYQHDRIAFRQNLINGLFTGAVEFEAVERKKADDDLARRLARMEERLDKLASAGSK